MLEPQPQGTPLYDAPLKVVADDAQWELYLKVEDPGVLKIADFRGMEIWLLDVAMGRFVVYDGNRTRTVELPQGSMPNGARFLDENDMLVCDRAKGLCRLRTEDDNQYEELETDIPVQFLGLNSLAFDGVGGAYVTDAGDSSHVDRCGALYYVWFGDGDFCVDKIAEGFEFPTGVAVSPDGSVVFVGELASNSIIALPSKLNLDSKDTPFVFNRFTTGRGIDGMTVDQAGNVYAAHLGAHEVVVSDAFNLRRTTLQLPSCAGPLPASVGIRNGYLYVCELSQGEVWRIPLL